MTYEALLRFTPAYDGRHFDDDASGARPELVVSHDALKKAKLNEPTPVVVDHDLGRVVGRVKEVFVGEDVDYGTRVRKWFFASCELDEKPDWLKRGCGVSWSYHPLHTYTAGDAGTTVLTSCLFREVSLLTPSTAPAEPLARVCLVKELPAAAGSSDRAAAEVIVPPTAPFRSDSELEEMRRRIDWVERRTGRTADVEAIVLAMQRELHGPSLRDLALR